MESNTNGTQPALNAGPFPYTLEPYKGPESRHTCPQCGAAHKFARYIDAATGQYIAEDCGRCDREDSCGYHLKPREYFNRHPERAGDYKPLKRDKAPALVVAYTPPPPLESYTIPKAKVKALKEAEAKAETKRLASQKRGNTSTLHYFLYKTLGPERYRKAAGLYMLDSWRGAAVFWYIDKGRRIRTGKAMYYHDNGHRNKDFPPFYMHPIINAGPGLPEGWHLRRCLFGEHLLDKHPGAPVLLVESEKTAIIASALTEGPGVWLAAGGLHYLNADSCRALKGRNVIAYPDLKAFDKWHARLQDLAPVCGFNVTISDYLERRASPEQRAAGLDIADFLIDEIQPLNTPKQ